MPTSNAAEVFNSAVNRLFDYGLSARRDLHLEVSVLCRGSVGDLQQALFLFRIERPLDLDLRARCGRSMPSRVSHASHRGVDLSVFQATVAASSGQPLRSAYIRSVMEVQAPRAATSRSKGSPVGPRIGAGSWPAGCGGRARISVRKPRARAGRDAGVGGRLCGGLAGAGAM